MNMKTYNISKNKNFNKGNQIFRSLLFEHKFKNGNVLETYKLFYTKPNNK